MPSYTPDHDLKPEPYTTPKKEHGESFEEAANPPNNPKKDKQPTHYNVTYDYCDHDTETADDY